MSMSRLQAAMATADAGLSQTPWTNVYGLARSLLALGTASTLAFSHSTSLFCPAVGRAYAVQCSNASALSLFCLLRSHLEFARVLAVLTLLLVASGWRPAVMGVMHWWISFSLQSSATMVDGGDQISAVLTLLLLPATLTDPRKWHWGWVSLDTSFTRRFIAMSAFFMIRLQMAGLYFHAALAKTQAQEWMDGTALYYWLNDASFGAPPMIMAWLNPLLRAGAFVTAASWGVILFEFLMSAAFFSGWRYRFVMFYVGVAFHFAIAGLHGLISFSIAMIGGLILYLIPVTQRVTWEVEMPSSRRLRLKEVLS